MVLLLVICDTKDKNIDRNFIDLEMDAFVFFVHRYYGFHFVKIPMPVQ